MFTDVVVITRRRNSTKKLLIVKQLFFLDRIRFIKSEISNTSIVFLYLDEHGLLASSLMLEMPEKKKDGWLQSLEKAKVGIVLIEINLLLERIAHSQKSQKERGKVYKNFYNDGGNLPGRFFHLYQFPHSTPTFVIAIYNLTIKSILTFCFIGEIRESLFWHWIYSRVFSRP